MPKDIFLDGLIDGGGEIILKDFKLHLLNLDMKCPDLQVRWQPSMRARGSIDLTISGKADNPQINGSIKLNQFCLPQGFTSISFLKTQKPDIDSGFLKNSSLNINISGDDIVVQNHNLKVYLDVSLMLKKDRDEKTFLLGKMEITKGVYLAHDNRFRITKGQIIFTQEDKSPLIEAEAETKVRRYKILAKVKGTIDDSRLILTSRPELTHAEMVSLLVFGKRFNNLTHEEKEELAGENLKNILVNNIFLGKAEVKLAESIGLDDINVNLDMKPDATGRIKAPSLEVGKYIAGEKLYGTYRIRPKDDKAKSDAPEQAMGTELGISNNITLKGERRWHKSWMTSDEDKLNIEFKWRF